MCVMLTDGMSGYRTRSASWISKSPSVLPSDPPSTLRCTTRRTPLAATAVEPHSLLSELLPGTDDSPLADEAARRLAETDIDEHIGFIDTVRRDDRDVVLVECGKSCAIA